MTEVATSSTTSEFDVIPAAHPATDTRLQEIFADPGFGSFFSDHMATVSWSEEDGWTDAKIEPYGPIPMDPASSVLHYAQEVFEGMKCYRHADGSIWAFRPEQNGERLALSAQRLALPALPMELFLDSLRSLVSVDQRWVPAGGETSLYLRPFIFGSEAFLGVRASRKAKYICIASPTASFFKGGVAPVSIWLSQNYTRAAAGGTGEAKCGGNYAASLLATREASEQGCQQVCFLDAAEHRWVEELGGMNLFFVTADRELITPELGGTILRGITRKSLITLAHDLGYTVTERRFGIDEWRDGVRNGTITEVFACGTAAVITPVGELKDPNGTYVTPTAGLGPVASDLRTALLDIQYGRAEDRHSWMTRIV